MSVSPLLTVKIVEDVTHALGIAAVFTKVMNDN